MPLRISSSFRYFGIGKFQVLQRTLETNYFLKLPETISSYKVTQTSMSPAGIQALCPNHGTGSVERLCTDIGKKIKITFLSYRGNLIEQNVP